MLVQFCIDRPFDMKYFAASAALVGIFESCDRVTQEYGQRWPGQLRYFRADANIICILGRCEYNGVHFDSRFVSREGAKNAKEKACDGFSVPSLEKVSSATEFRPLRVLCGFA
jgi:hypothetical protein